MRLGFLLALALAAGLVPAASVGADDRTLREAGRSRDAQFKRLGEQSRRAARAWVSSGHSRRWARRLMRLNARLSREVGIVTDALQAEQPSSDRGATYKRLQLRALRHFDAARVWDSRGIRRFMRGSRGAAHHAWRRAELHFARARRLERRAIQAIES